MKIAIVDDDQTFTWLVEQQVKVYNGGINEHQITLKPWHNPVSFLECLRTKNDSLCDYDIVIIDMKMPNMDGFSVHEELMKLCPNLKCFINSSSIEDDDPYESMVLKSTFKIGEVIKRSFSISRLLNNLQIKTRKIFYEKCYA